MHAFLLRRFVFTVCLFCCLPVFGLNGFVEQNDAVIVADHKEFKAISCWAYWRDEQDRLILSRSIVPYGKLEGYPANSILKYLNMTENPGAYHSYEELILDEKGFITSGTVGLFFLKGFKIEQDESNTEDCSTLIHNHKLREREVQGIFTWSLETADSDNNQQKGIKIPRDTIPLLHIAQTEQPYKTLYDPLLSMDPWNLLNHPDPPCPVDPDYIAVNALITVASFLYSYSLHPPPARYQFSLFMYRFRILINLGIGIMTEVNLLTEMLTQIQGAFPRITRRYRRWQSNCEQTQQLAKSNRAYRHAQAEVTGSQTSCYSARNTFWKRVAEEESSQNNTRSADYCTNSFNVLEKIQKDEYMATAILVSYRHAITKSQVKP